ncbi:MAG: ribbon-helix-helix domain-containing protein [Desulfohalobiaceae bacterium]
MKTVQMTLDEDLIQAVDQISKQLHTSRSAFAREALRDALARYEEARMEEKHRQGYLQHPVQTDEFSAWETEQDWGNE